MVRITDYLFMEFSVLAIPIKEAKFILFYAELVTNIFIIINIDK